jgi:hypothetical protein
MARPDSGKVAKPYRLVHHGCISTDMQVVVGDESKRKLGQLFNCCDGKRCMVNFHPVHPGFGHGISMVNFGRKWKKDMGFICSKGSGQQFEHWCELIVAHKLQIVRSYSRRYSITSWPILQLLLSHLNPPVHLLIPCQTPQHVIES